MGYRFFRAILIALFISVLLPSHAFAYEWQKGPTSGNVVRLVGNEIFASACSSLKQVTDHARSHTKAFSCPNLQPVAARLTAIDNRLAELCATDWSSQQQTTQADWQPLGEEVRAILAAIDKNKVSTLDKYPFPVSFITKSYCSSSNDWTTSRLNTFLSDYSVYVGSPSDSAASLKSALNRNSPAPNLRLEAPPSRVAD